MNILIFNCGSSSQGFKLFRVDPNGIQEILIQGKARNVATFTQAQPFIDWSVNGEKSQKNADLSSHALAAAEIISVIKQYGFGVDAIGHRFVHGGDLFTQTTRIDAKIMEKLAGCFSLAPIHNPNSFAVIQVCLQSYPGLSQFAVFDTAFHAQMPESSKQYGLPRDLIRQFGYHKYGFHGLSYQFVSQKAAACLGKPLANIKCILCHLGTGGSSVAALRDGHSIDNSMGYSPLPGLVMSTRSGDLDPEIVLDMVRRGFSADEISQILNNRSGLIGLSGFSSNLEEIINEAEKGDAGCRLAYDVYTNRLKFYISAYVGLLNGADLLAFTDDIGVKSWKLRQAVCANMDYLGILLDQEANRKAVGGVAAKISSPESPTQVWVIPTDEEQVMLEEVAKQFFPG